LEEEEFLEREVAVEAHIEVSSKLGTHKTVKTRFWPLRLGRRNFSKENDPPTPLNP